MPTDASFYADRDGHIESHLWNGILPKRDRRAILSTGKAVPGDTSETLWTTYHSFDELPKVIDPPNGYVHNTNDPPWNAGWPTRLDPANYPPYIAARNISFRAERSLRMLYENPKFTYDQFVENKHSTHSRLAGIEFCRK